MENKNTGLKVMVIILCLLVLGLSGYIVYDKVFSDEKENVQNMNGNENSTNDNKNNNENRDEQDTSDYEELDKNTISELKKVFRFVYDYYDWGNAYCGSYSKNDTIYSADYYNANYYTASSQYSSFNKMINHLKEYMTEHVIYGKHYMSSDTYIEKDGKLYCPDFGKDGNLYQLEDITIKDSKTYDTHIYTTVETKLVYEGTIYETYKVTFEKRDNRWIISSYEKQD